MRLGVSAAGLLLLSACLGETGGFVANGGSRVNPVNADVFEVIAPSGNEANQLWCGAGEYARRALGARPGDRVYVVSAGGPATTTSAPNSAQFSLKSPSQVTGAAGHTSRWGPRLGQSRYVGDALDNCRKGPDRLSF